MPRPKQTATESEAIDTPRLTLAQKLLCITDELAGTKKTGTLPGNLGGKPYYTDEDITNALRPLLIRYGVLILPSVHNGSFIDGVSKIAMSFNIIDTETSLQYLTSMEGIGTETKSEKIGYSGTSMKKAITSATRYFYLKLFHLSDHIDDEQENGIAQTTSQSAVDKVSTSPYGEVTPSSKNAATVKQTANKDIQAAVVKDDEVVAVSENGNKIEKEKRPFTAEQLLTYYTKALLSDMRPVSDDKVKEVSQAINSITKGDKETSQRIKDFFGIKGRADVTSGNAGFLLSWIAPKFGTDGGVTVSRHINAELQNILEWLVKQAEELI